MLWKYRGLELLRAYCGMADFSKIRAEQAKSVASQATPQPMLQASFFHADKAKQDVQGRELTDAEINERAQHACAPSKTEVFKDALKGAGAGAVGAVAHTQTLPVVDHLQLGVVATAGALVGAVRGRRLAHAPQHDRDDPCMVHETAILVTEREEVRKKAKEEPTARPPVP